MTKQLKPRKGQLCCRCFKPIKDDWAYNGNWFHGKCKDKDTARRIKDYVKDKGFVGTCPEHNQDYRKCPECVPGDKKSKTPNPKEWMIKLARKEIKEWQKFIKLSEDNNQTYDPKQTKN